MYTLLEDQTKCKYNNQARSVTHLNNYLTTHTCKDWNQCNNRHHQWFNQTDQVSISVAHTKCTDNKRIEEYIDKSIKKELKNIFKHIKWKYMFMISLYN